MAPPKDPSPSPENQPRRRARWLKPRARRPRSRRCLLQGCERVFRPQQPFARYCSGACYEQARRWREKKKREARQRYRQSPNGKQKRQAQSRRYRERRKAKRKTALRGARVIPTPIFFVRPPGLL
jgi:hypothetical protein